MNAIEITDLTKKYSGFQLDHLNLTLPRGCIMGLIGENGAGKTTTIKLILDMIHKDSGTIRVMGKDHLENIRQLKEDIGVVLDEAGFPECLNARQVNNIMKKTYQNWDAPVYENYMKNLSIPTEKPFKDFSRGMKMKLAIAVAMSHHPKLLILDEATGGLDPVVRSEVIDMFNEFTRDEDHSVLMSSHIVSDLEKICDYIAFLHKGKLLLCEEKDVLIEEYGVLHCSCAQLRELAPSAIKGRRVSSYGAEAIVKRDAVPPEWSLSPVNIEDLFVFMIKEED